jgi:hypothetical protein
MTSKGLSMYYVFRAFFILIIFSVFGCGGDKVESRSESKPVLNFSLEIGTYFNEAVDLFSSQNLVELGNGLFINGNNIEGWPRNSGTYSYNFNSTELKFIIKPMVKEVYKGKDGIVSLVWDKPQSNKIVFYDLKGSEKILAVDDGGVKWQVNADIGNGIISWLNFPSHKGNDQVVVLDLNDDSVKVFEDENIIHRKPVYNQGYLYWYQERMASSGNRDIGVYRVDLKSNMISEVSGSEYPNTITDYNVAANGVVAIVKKNYDQQRSDVYLLNNEGGSLFYKEDSFVQNLFSYGHDKFAFEIKKHSGNWAVFHIDTAGDLIGSVSDNSLAITVVDDQLVMKNLSKPVDSNFVFSELLNRYSPPIIGLSRYNNKFGTLSISEAAVIRSLVTVSLEESFNKNYWYEIAERALNLIGRVDRDIGVFTYDSSSTSHWSVSAFNDGDSSFIPFLVHDSSILDALLLLATQLKYDEVLNASYPGLYGEILYLFESNYTESINELVSFDGDKYGIIESGEVYFTFKKGSPYQWDGVNLPFNMMNSYVRPLLMYYDLTGVQKYNDLALSIGSLFKRHLIPLEITNSYVWPYWWGLYDKGWSGSDISTNTPEHNSQSVKLLSDVDHSSLDIRAVNSLFKRGMVFDDEDVLRISNTMAFNLTDNDYRSPLIIDGSITSANYNSIEYLWAEVAEFSYDSCVILNDSLMYFPYVQDAYTPTGRYELVGLSHLIKENCK